MTDNKLLYQPQKDIISQAHQTVFMNYINQKYSINLREHSQLDQWAIKQNDKFWDSIWDYCKIIGQKGEIVKTDERELIEVQFFPQARLNYAQNLLEKTNNDEIAVIFKSENHPIRKLTGIELKNKVSIVQQFLIEKGIKKGDRVAGVVANTPETLIAMLATSSLGAVWTSCSPDFGKESILERFSQTQPKLVFASQNYFYNLKQIDCVDKICEVLKELTSVECTVFIEINAQKQKQIQREGVYLWSNLMSKYTANSINYTLVKFQHPLFIMYSSGTTGMPKCIVHSVGGTLIEHLKEHQLHCDIKKSDRVFYFTTCGWMMWNWQMSVLASGACLVLFDGSPMASCDDLLFDYIDQAQITLFGTSAKFIETLIKKNIQPKTTHSLASLKTICSTGSPLSSECFEYVYESIKKNLHLASIAGGTDIIGCFILGSPISSVYAGEIQIRSYGLDVQVFDETANSVVAEKGELVCLNAFPSMPVCFWNDTHKQKYKNTYFNDFDNIWKHGDFIEQTKNKSYVIYGRSDATLNPGGVRIGTAEIYRQIIQMTSIQDSVIVGQNFNSDIRIILFVVLKEGLCLDDELKNKIKLQIRTNCTPRHMPAKIIQVTDIPRTRSGKITELAVKNIIEGREVKNSNALINPQSLEQFKNLKELNS